MSAEYLDSETPRDYYTEFIENSRWLRKEQAEARSAWYKALTWDHKEETIFKFEMLLKGLVCLGNPINHPGSPIKDEFIAGKEFDNELGVVQSTIRKIIEMGKLLSGDRDNSITFQRYLESLVVQDHARIQMAKESLYQDTPEQSLTLMMAAMENLREVVEGLSAVTAVSFKLYTSVVKIAQREIHRSDYFDPLAPLEFRAEFDRIKVPSVLEVIAGIKSDPARRVAALSFLALFRLLRYLDVMAEEQARKGSLGPLFAFLAVLRSDAWALGGFFCHDAAAWVSDGFGRLYEDLNPSEITGEFSDFTHEFKELKALKELLGSTGNQLRLELRKMYEQQLPSLNDIDDKEQLGEAVNKSIFNLRSFLQNTVVMMVGELSSKVEGDRLFENFTSDMVRAERLRRDVWMFRQILRAFVEKAKGSIGTTDQWAEMSTLRFVKDFVSYFKSMGYQLLRYSDYARFDGFMNLIDSFRDGNVIEVQRLHQVVATCEDFNDFLAQMFEAVSHREELKDVEFDKKDAVKTLKLFLDH